MDKYYKKLETCESFSELSDLLETVWNDMDVSDKEYSDFWIEYLRKSREISGI